MLYSRVFAADQSRSLRFNSFPFRQLPASSSQRPVDNPFGINCFSAFFVATGGIHLPFWNSPQFAHLPFFPITYVEPILQVFSFDVHPSNGGPFATFWFAATTVGESG